MFHKRLWVIERLFYVFVCIDFLNSIEFLIVCLLIWFQPLFLCESCVLADLQGNWLWCLISSYLIPVIIDFVYLGKIKWFAGLPQLPSRKVWSFRAWRKSFPEWFGISARGESYFLNGLEFSRMAKALSRIVLHFRAWRKSFPERFGISAHGESCFPNSLAFPRMAKVSSRMVWSFRRTRKHLWEVGLCVVVCFWFPIIFLFYNRIRLFVRRLFVAWIVPNDEPWGDGKDEEREREIIIEYSIVVFEKIENAM